MAIARASIRAARRCRSPTVRPARTAVPPTLDFSLFTLFATSYPAYKGFMMLVSIGMFLVLYVALKRRPRG